MVCPICNKAGIDLSEKNCPQCGSDFSALNNINLLKTKIAQRYFSRILLLTFIFATLLLIIVSIQYTGLFSDNNLLKIQIVDLKDSLNKYRLINDSIKTQSTLESSNIAREIIYTVKTNDSLWKLSRIFYDDGSKYYKIIKYNNLVSNLLIKGQVLKIPLD